MSHQSAFLWTTRYYLYCSASDWDAIFNNQTRYRGLRAVGLYSVVLANRHIRARAFRVYPCVGGWAVDLVNDGKCTGGYFGLPSDVVYGVVNSLIRDGRVCCGEVIDRSVKFTPFKSEP